MACENTAVVNEIARNDKTELNEAQVHNDKTELNKAQTENEISQAERIEDQIIKKTFKEQINRKGRKKKKRVTFGGYGWYY